MAVTIDRAGLINALRLVESAPITAEIDRLLEYCTEAITRVAPVAPDTVHNQAMVQLVGFLYQHPGALSGRAMRLSGAYDVLRGYYTFAQAGESPAGGGDGTDETARQLARAASQAADAAAAAAAAAARNAATAQGEIDTHEAAPHNTDTTARAAAAAAQGDIDAHKANHPAGGGGADAAARARLDAIEADDWVTGRRIAAKTIGSGLLVDNIIDEERLIADDVIETQHIAANAVTESELHGDVTDELDKIGGLDTRVTALESHPGTDRDNVARAAAATAQGDINTHKAATHNTDATARAAAAAAQLAGDTVVTVGPELIHNDTDAFNLSVALRHPVNAYPRATVVSVAVGFQPAVIVGYVANDTDQHVIAEIPTLSLTNIWNLQDSIDDGAGGTRNVQRYPVGSFVPVEIRLLTGRGGDTLFRRVVDLRVVAPVAAPAGGGFPTTRNTIYARTQHRGRIAPAITLTENIGADNLYEVLLESSRANEVSITYILPLDGTRKYDCPGVGSLEYVLTLTTGSTRAVIDKSGTSGTIFLTINKLT